MSDGATVSDGVLAHLREVAARPGDPLPAAGEEGPSTQRSDGEAGGRQAAGERYELLGVLGQGGMGTVYRALDRSLGREVALKVIREAAAARFEAPDQRLLDEARILARLEHPGLVPVHDLGTLPDGRVFYAMKQVRGERLDAYVRSHTTLGRVEVLRLFERVCETVAFAHAQGVIHRDLKPGNIMVGPFGEVLVLDWGLAKVQTRPDFEGGDPEVRQRAVAVPSRGSDSASGTAPGTVLGTPGYMAPEQQQGRPADARSDVYALGAILRFLLTGSPEANGVIPAVPAALRAMVAMSTAPDPQDRYPGAAELRADLARFLSGGAVEAFPEGPLRRGLRFCRRHATAILLVLGYLLVRLALIVFTHQ